MTMRYGSVCSGIEAATVAWHGINATMCMTCEGLGRYGGHLCESCEGRGYVDGWKPAFFSEIEKFPSALLAHHYPDVPNLGDMTRFSEWPDAAIDVLVGGTPCQSFSVAGLRKGLADPRGNLMLTYLAIADRYRPRWLVWENVPGVLSSAEGRDFGALLGGLGELGYGFAYRVLDAQYFGVAQRRRRVFVVGYLGDWRPAAAVLFERASLQGHPAPRRKAGQGAAAGFETGPSGGRFTDLAPTMDCRAKNGPMQNQLGAGVVHPIALHPRSVGRDNAGPEGKDWRDDGASFTMDTSGAGSVCHTLRAEHDASEDGTGRGTPLVPVIGFNAGSQPIPINTMVATRHEALGEGTGLGIGQPGDPANTITKGHSHAVAQPIGFQSSQSGVREVDTHATLDANNGSRRHNGLMEGMAVRRLTPRECERLQGFPDGYTDVPFRGKPAADGPRYKALGNSMAVPVMAWIGKRIQQVEDILNGVGA